MCRTYYKDGKPYVRLCYYTGRKGQRIPGRLGHEVPAKGVSYRIHADLGRRPRTGEPPEPKGPRCRICGERNKFGVLIDLKDTCGPCTEYMEKETKTWKQAMSHADPSREQEQIPEKLETDQ